MTGILPLTTSILPGQPQPMPLIDRGRLWRTWASGRGSKPDVVHTLIPNQPRVASRRKKPQSSKLHFSDACKLVFFLKRSPGRTNLGCSISFVLQAYTAALKAAADAQLWQLALTLMEEVDQRGSERNGCGDETNSCEKLQKSGTEQTLKAS